MAAHQTQPSHWRRQSTLILSSTKFDGSLAPESPQSSLKPPSASTNNGNRNSFGFWGGSKSAASTPNLGNTVGTNHSNGHQELTSSSITVDSEVLGQGSGELSAGSVDSSSSSFSQRRKRSESTGGLKHTAGNISKIVKKSSSNFLKKFVKTFDDKDAPPTPVTPASNGSSVRSLPHVSRQVTAPELPPLAPPHGHQSRIGPLDTPPPLSPLLGQELENHFSTISPNMPNMPNMNPQLQQPMHGSSVESWLNSTNQGISSNGYQANFVPLSGESTPLDRRRSRVADTLNDLDDDEEVDEDEDEDLPADISNRLSKLYESSSIHPNQSQTSLYYSTKSSLSDSEAADSGSRRTSLAQDALGYSLGLSRGSSIRFSQYSLGSLHLAPLTGSASTPSSPNKNPMEYIEGRPTPRRPATMFIPLSGGTDNGTSAEDALKTDRTRTTRANSEASHAGSSNVIPPSPATLLTPIVTREVPRLAGTRPVTICVSPQDITIPSTPNLSTIMTPVASTEDQPAMASQNAKRCYDEDESFLKRGEIAEYLGAPKPFNRLVLKYYMDYFDFAGKRLDMAFRVLCQKLVLRGETQEVDRILEVFAERYVTCNPRSLLGGADHSKDVVHAITYSILLLNTDLHIVQQSSKMSKSAFIKNTLQAIQSQSQQASSGDDSSSTLTGNTSTLGLPLTITGDSMYGSPTSSKKRPPSVKSWKSGQSHQSGIGQILSGHYHSHSGKMGTDAKANGGYGNGKWWQQELESLLKDIYSSVKQHQILLPASSTNLSPPGSRSHGTISSPPTSPTTSGFGSSFFSSNRMSRLISSSSHDSSSGSSGFGLGFSSGRRNSVSARTKQLRSEAIQRLNAQAQSQPSGIETEQLTRSAPLPMTFNPLNVRHSVAGPLLSESFLLDFNSNNIGSNKDRDLGRGILRSGEDQSQYSSSSRLSSLTMATSQAALSNASTVTTTPSASQNSLASLQSYSTSNLTGAEDCQSSQKKQALAQFQKDQLHQQHIQTRYRMEGILWRKHLLERTDKKAQHRAWRQLLVIVDPDQGTLSMFRSDGSLPKALSATYKQQPHGSTTSLPTSSSMPLGDHDADMPLFDEIPLQHTITNILPPPGYSSSRRHVFAVQLHTGAVYLFQTTSPQECEAWARTCNYWAARTSKEPLLGGVVNMEYGWGRALDLLARQEEEQRHQAMGGQEGGRMTPASDLSQSSITTRSVTSINTRVALDYSSAPTDYLGEALGLGFNPTSSAASGGVRTPSVRSGTRGSFSSASGVLPGNGNSGTTATTGSGGTGHGSLGDSISLFEWTAPMPTMTASKLNEEDQMLALRKYVASLESDMEVHQDHRLPMTRLFMPKTSNHTKAFNNWERRSRYLLKEMVKYQIYVECLEQSLQLQQKLQHELERAQAQQEQLDLQYENHERGGLLRASQRTEDDLEAELAKLIVHEGPHTR